MKTLLEAAVETSEKIEGLKKAFGAPGDHGYETREGRALYELYMAWAKLNQAIDAERRATS